MAQAKFDSISDIITQANQEENIFSAQFHKIQQELEEYHKLKKEIRTENKANIKQITKKN